MGKKGFTLIELLVVIAIIGLLSSIIIVGLSNARAKGRNAKRVAEIRQIATAIELYFSDNNKYPKEHWWDTSIGCKTTNGVPPDGQKWNDGNCPAGETLDVLLSNYIPLPLDPINESYYYYDYQGIWSGSQCCIAYRIEARLETTNPQPYFRICNGNYAGSWIEASCQQPNPSP